MSPLHITVNLERQPWSDVDGASPCTLERIGLHPNVSVEGGASVVILGRHIVDGRMVVATTTYRLFSLAARVFAATPAGLLLAEEFDNG